MRLLEDRLGRVTAHLVVRIAALFFCFILTVWMTVPAHGENQSAYDEAMSWMLNEKKASGSLPGPFELAERINAAKDSLPPEKKEELWRAWWKAQQPTINKDELIEILKAKREAIENCRLRYSVQIEEAAERGEWKPSGYETHQFLMKHGKLKVERDRGSSPEQLDGVYIRAYDGQMVRTFKDYEKPVGARGTVEKFQSRRAYFDLGSPLGLQMMLNSETDVDLKRPVYDLVDFLQRGGYILERPETVNGRKALVCARGLPPVSQVWLDPERNFAVLRFQTNYLHRDEDGPYGAVFGLSPEYTREATDFQDCGGGIWLPETVVEERFYDENRVVGPDVVNRTVSKVHQMEINQPIEDSEFQRIFPPGTFVDDSVVDATYYVGTDDEFEKVVSETVAPVKDATAPSKVEVQPDQPSGPAERDLPQREGIPEPQERISDWGGIPFLLLAAVVIALAAAVLIFWVKRVKSANK